MRHPPDATLREGDATLRESPVPAARPGEATRREDPEATVREPARRDAPLDEASGGAAPGGRFHEYRLLEQLPSTSSEADIFIMADERGARRLLKLYRFGIVPKTEVLRTVQRIGAEHPDSFVRLFAVDFDARLKRWYAVQEYAAGGSLQTLLDAPERLPPERRPGFFVELAREAGRALHILHRNNILHLDLKPANILLRALSPLNLALIDFGIATSLDPEMSRKFTQTRGTPMYQSPESWAGSMGRASDWWGLGMVLLEVATGRHPFAGLSGNVIAQALATRSVPVPDTLDPGRQELLRGLLTRDPAKRWHWEQISRWLTGERGIPQYFEGPEAVSAGRQVRPLVFMGRPCRSLGDLARRFAESEEAWAQGRALLMRGQVRRWVESTQLLEAGVGLDSVLAGGGEDPDARTCHFVAAYGSGPEFVFLGHRVSVNNLALFAGRRLLDASSVSAAEQRILDAAADGSLPPLLDHHARLRGASAEAEAATLRPFLLRLQGMALEDTALFLDFCLNPDRYHCPFVARPATPGNVLRDSTGLEGLPLTREHWQALEQEYVLPDALHEKMRDAASYREAVVWLEQMAAQGQGLRLNEVDADQARIIAAFLPCRVIDRLTRPFVHYCLHPERYHSPFLTALEPAYQVAWESADLRVLPLTLDEWTRLNRNWIVPRPVVQQMHRAETYHLALAWLEDHRDNLLPRAGLTDEEARLLSLCRLNLRNPEAVHDFIEFCRHPKRYFCPFVELPATPESAARDAAKLTRPPLTRKRWIHLSETYHIPADIRRQLQSADTYDAAADWLEEMEKQQELLPQNRRKKLERRLIQGLIYGLALGATLGLLLLLMAIRLNHGVIQGGDPDVLFIVVVVLVIVVISVAGSLLGAYERLKRGRRKKRNNRWEDVR